MDILELLNILSGTFAVRKKVYGQICENQENRVTT